MSSLYIYLKSPVDSIPSYINIAYCKTTQTLH